MPSPLGTNLPVTTSDVNQVQKSASPAPEATAADGCQAYPNQSSWLPWVTEAVLALDPMSNTTEWKECVAAWLKMEHQLGYPMGMVGLIPSLLVALADVTGTEKRT